MNSIFLTEENPSASDWLPDSKPDNSGIGANYTEAYIKPFNRSLADGTKVTCKRLGLKILVQVADSKGQALMRRQKEIADVHEILRRALVEAFEEAGYKFILEEKRILLERTDSLPT